MNAPTPRSEAMGNRSPVARSNSEKNVQMARARPLWRCAGGRKPPMRSILVAAQHHFLVTVHVLEDLPGAEDYAGERIIGDPDIEVRDFAHEQIEAAEQRPAAGHEDAAIHDVRRQLGRRALEALAQRVD